MKSSSLFSRLVLTIAGALALGACSRSEYAMLPKSASYLGTSPVATPAARPLATPASTTEAPVATVVPVPAAKPLATAKTEGMAPPTAATPAAPAHLKLVQRLALKKITNKLDKLASKAPVLKKHEATASTAELDQGLRTSLIVLLVGVIVSALSGISVIFGVIGGIIIIIGLVLLLLYLLDKA